ncbi:MAG: V-type ATP synthase subunit A [Candidatus Heimdallarchaeota archaeon]
MRIAGPVVDVKGLSDVELFEILRVGEEALMGEVIKIEKKPSGHIATVQVYEETAGLRPGEQVEATGLPLSAVLGPGLIGQIFDGIQRPLPSIKEATGDFIHRGVVTHALDLSWEFEFNPSKQVGEKVQGGAIIGSVPETSLVTSKVLVPPRVASGKIKEIKPAGKYPLKENMAIIDTATGEVPVKMYHEWPVRIQRPFSRKLASDIPLITGQRIFDTFFPLSKGGTGAIPGGFGTGKCVTGDTPVFLENGNSVAISELYEQYLKENGVLIEDTEDETLIQLKAPLRVISFDGKGYIPQAATHVYRGTTDEVIKITTRTGRKVQITPIHKLFRFNGETIEEIEARNLKIGEHLVVPRKLQIEGEVAQFDPYDVDLSLRVVDPLAIQQMLEVIGKLKETMTLKELAKKVDVSYAVFIEYWLKRNKPTLGFLEKLAKLADMPRIPVELVKAERQSEPFRIPRFLTKELAEWLGLFVADGHIKGSHHGIYLYNSSNQILERFRELTAIIFDTDVKFGQDSPERTPFACIRNASLRRFLYYLGIPRSDKTHTVRVPESIRRAPNSYLVHFLAGYFSGDGSFYRYTVNFCTSSLSLYSDIGYLLTRLGILYKGRTKAEAYLLDIDGKEAELLGQIFLSNQIFAYEKLEPLYNYVTREIEHFMGLDIVPVASQLLAQIKEQGKDPDGLDAFRKFEGLRLDNYTKRGQTPSLKALHRIAKVLDTHETKIEPKVRDRFDHVMSLLEEAYFDRITAIELEETETPVYDLTVEMNHNFVGGVLPFTLHNTVSQHQLAKWSDATVVVYIGCGERGNEMTEVLEEFPELEDPRTGEKLMKRTILIANTSNMPVAAREASIYTGITLAEFFRDQGFDVALMADSTSRWAEALREISGRLEEMPGEQGYPAYLASKVAEFYERAGRVETLNGDAASISAVGAVSPGGGDFSEPVTQNTLRTVRVFWALSKSLASSRHFPAISWLESYSMYTDSLQQWFQTNVDSEFGKLREVSMALLQKEKELQEIVQLVGPDALPESEKITLQAAKMIREDFLQQNAYSEDSYCSLDKQYRMLNAIMRFYDRMVEWHGKGISIEEMVNLPLIDEIARLKWRIDDFDNYYQQVIESMDKAFA